MENGGYDMNRQYTDFDKFTKEDWYKIVYNELYNGILDDLITDTKGVYNKIKDDDTLLDIYSDFIVELAHILTKKKFK